MTEELPPNTETPPKSLSLINARLGSTMSADFEALRNDLDQAQDLAAEFQRQVAGKSNELAELRQVFEKTSRDLERMHADIGQMRQERHDLANRAMVAHALELKLARSVSDGERLRAEAAALQAAANAAAEQGKAEIRRLEIENARLLTQIEGLKLHGTSAPRGESPEVMAVLAKILTSMEGLRESFDTRQATYIDVAFDR